MKALITTLLIVGVYTMSVLTTLNAYGLTWPWLIGGSIATAILIAIGGEVGK